MPSGQGKAGAYIMLFPVALFVLLVFMNRYVLGAFLALCKGRRYDRTVEGYEPTVTVVIPLYNEGKGIYDAIISLLAQDYPAEKLTITVVDDCSKDDSYLWACRAAESNPGRVHVLKNPYNMGKRRGINHAVREATAEIIVSVDSDVIVDKSAVRHLVARFVRPELAAVGGRVNVSNANENWLTRMQAIKYYFSYQYMKCLERSFTTVMCLSGCLTAYRRSVLIELEPILEDRNILGVPIKYGEDRFLTRQIVKAGYDTTITLEAMCWTVAPNTLAKYFSQQLRWRRSNLVDFLAGLSHAYRLRPVIALHYLSLFAVMVLYPLIIAESIVSDQFLPLATYHLGVLTILGAVYWFGTRSAPPETRVHPLWFLPMAAVMPVTYLVYTVLAFFTLDSGSWETRKVTNGTQTGKPPESTPIPTVEAWPAQTS